MDQQQICTPQYIICLHLIENISAALYSHLSPPWTELIFIYLNPSLTPVSQPHMERTQTCGSCKVNSPYILVLLQYGCVSVC